MCKEVATVVGGIICIAIVAVFVIPGFVRAPMTSGPNACVNNLRNIDRCKKSWALEHERVVGDVVTWDDVRPYLPYPDLPYCPGGGTYRIGRVGTNAACTIDWHTHDYLTDEAHTEP
jgi:hypothetical protein